MRRLWISLKPQTGLFPVLRMPLHEFTNKTVELDEIIKDFTNDMTEKIAVNDSNTEAIEVIETEIVKLIDITLWKSKNPPKGIV